MSWFYTAEKVDIQINRISNAIVRKKAPLVPFALTRDGKADGTVAKNGSYKAIAETVTLTTEVQIPPDWGGQKVYLALELYGAETLVYVDGKPVQAIDKYHHDLLLSENAHPGQVYDIRLESYTGSIQANQHTGWLGGVAATDGFVNVEIRQAELQWIDRETEALYFDAWTAFNALKVFDKDSRDYAVVLQAIEKSVDQLDFTYGTDNDAFYESVKYARKIIKSELYDKLHGDPAFRPTMKAVGHAHIDTAWLWTIAHTRKKIGRTFSTQLTNAERFPGYVFTCSQPQQYAYLKEDYPDVYVKIQEAVRKGSWETVGGMWIESDCNVISGESLVRQFLHGLRFYKKEFGTHTDVVWLPDVFGYCASMPQIIKKVGMKYFMTIKIYWSQINKPPYQTFEWEGIDGTKVLTHFAPGGDYNASMDPEQVHNFWQVYKQKNVNDSAIYIFGHGDGGGGPTRQMLEKSKRLADFPHIPKVEYTSAQKFFEELEKQVEGNKLLPRWVGELYLEYHRGTYTSQANNKCNNRRAEQLLQTAEQLCSLAKTVGEFTYPQESLNKAWELTLLNQFHDIIPGSSINEVYRESDADYAHILSKAQDAADSALTSIASNVAPMGSVVVYNPLSWQRKDVAALPKSLGLQGQQVTSLQGDDLTLVPLRDVPALGYSVVSTTEAEPESGLSATDYSLENRFFKIKFDHNGEIESIIDKRLGREIIDSASYCKGNSLLTFEDKPMAYDAWDIDIYYQDKMTCVTGLKKIEVVESGPERATVQVEREFGRGSTIVQRISLWRNLDRIDFATKIDWQERNTLLKAAFPVTVHSPRATYDIQFGNVERPTHWNTSWDWARFEVCAQKWADLSEGDYGVALLSESKYGWDIKGNVMRLTLLKGAEYPDAQADLGVHYFTYSLYPHQGGWREGGVVQRAYELNVPVQAAVSVGSGGPAASVSFVATDRPNLILETIKKAEDSDSLIVRLYEAYGQRGQGELRFLRDVKSAKEVNMIEEPLPRCSESCRGRLID